MTSQAQGRVFGAADALAVNTLKYLAAPTLSPDGNEVAYVVYRGDAGAHCKECETAGSNAANSNPIGRSVPLDAQNGDVWLTNVRSGTSVNLTKERGSSWGPVWSMSGEYLVFYSASESDGKVELWVWSRKTSKSKQLVGVDVAPRLGTREIQWVADNREVLVPLKATALESDEGESGKPESPHSSALRPTSTVSVSVSPEMSVAPRSGGPPTPEFDLGTVNIITGDVRVIARRIPDFNYWLSPDRKNVAILAWREFLFDSGIGNTSVYDLLQCSVAEPRCDTLVQKIAMPQDAIAPIVSWSPDSRKLAYLAKGHLDTNGAWKDDRGDCYLVSLQASTPRNLTEGEHPPFESAVAGPVWSPGGQFVYVIASAIRVNRELNRWKTDSVWRIRVSDGQYQRLAILPGKSVQGILGIVPPNGPGETEIILAVQDEDSRQAGLIVVAESTGRVIAQSEGPWFLSDFSSIERSAGLNSEHSLIAYTLGTSDRPRDVWISDTHLRHSRRVTQINPQLEQFSFGRPRPIHFMNDDGQILHAALILPAGYVEGRRYPLVAWLYGGTFMSRMLFNFGLEGADSQRSTLNVQLLASHGYAVLVPDVVMDPGVPALGILKSVAPAVNKVIELGIADPARCGVFGHSFGGYATLATITQTTRFKAAVMYAGISDVLSFHAVVPSWAEMGQLQLGGPPWQFPERYVANTPIFHLDRVQTPLLVIHGDQDGVPISQAEEIYAGLKRLGKDVTYIKYRGEDHVISGSANTIDFWNHVLSYFDFYLKEKQ